MIITTCSILQKDVNDVQWLGNITDSLNSLGKVYSNNESDVFKPPMSVQYSGKEYEFSKFSGRFFSYAKYKCTDYQRCKGSIKISSVDPSREIQIVHPHCEDCRSNCYGWTLNPERSPFEAQERYNYLVDYEIAQAVNTVEHPNSILKRLEIKARDMASEEGTHIFPPERTVFQKILRKERELWNPKTNLDKIIFSPDMSKTKTKQGFLRFSFNLVDKNGLMQQCILWISQKQVEFFRESPQFFISLTNQGIPKWFGSLLVIMNHSKT